MRGLLVVALAAVLTAAAAPRVTRAAFAPGATKAQAITLVTQIVRSNATECRLALRRVTAARIPVGWRVTVTVKIRGARGVAAWHVAGRIPKPADPFAKSISKGCQ